VITMKPKTHNYARYVENAQRCLEKGYLPGWLYWKGRLELMEFEANEITNNMFLRGDCDE
jgi:hypothetical protein